MPEPTVLLADDNDDLRMLSAHALETAGAGVRFSLIETSSAPDALTRIGELAASGTRVLLVSDNRMPGMSGAELCHEARARHPDAPVKRVIITSAEPTPSVRSALEADGVQVHVRPFQLADLRALMQRVVDEWLR